MASWTREHGQLAPLGSSETGATTGIPGHESLTATWPFWKGCPYWTPGVGVFHQKGLHRSLDPSREGVVLGCHSEQSEAEQILSYSFSDARGLDGTGLPRIQCG